MPFFVQLHDFMLRFNNKFMPPDLAKALDQAKYA